MTSRTTAHLAAKAKGNKSMPIKREFVEDMYANVPQVLCAWLDWTCRIRVPPDDTHIRHTMSEVATLEYASVISGCGNTPRWSRLVERSLQRGTGNEPDKEQKETYTHLSFPMRKHGIAYTSRDARRRNPHSSWLVQRRGSPRKRARVRPLIKACRVGIGKFHTQRYA